MTAIETTYEECVGLLQDTVWKFIAKYGLPTHMYDELFSQANLAFVEAYKDHNENRSKFTTWLRNKVWWKLLMEWGKDSRHHLNTTREPRKMPHRKVQWCVDWLDALNEDAKNLVCMFQQSPKDLDKLYQYSLVAPAGKRVFHYLQDKGWTRGQIQSAIRNMKESAN